MSEEVYDNIRAEVKRIKKSGIPKEFREALSGSFWKLGHDLADDADHKVIFSASYLLGMAKSFKEVKLEGYVKDFINLYNKEKPLREARREDERKRQERKYMPEKTFAEDLAKLDPNSQFPGQEVLHFNSLYGKPQLDGSELIFLNGYPDSEVRNYPYLIGDDNRSTAEIWKAIDPVVSDRAMEMLEETVRHEHNAQYDYVGKLVDGHVTIAKELILPDIFKEEVQKYKKAMKKEPKTSLENSIVSGKFFIDMKRSELFEQKLIRILQKEGAKLGNRTVVDMSMWANSLSYPHTIELMENIADVLKDYHKEQLPWMSCGFFYEIPGYARADIDQLESSSDMFVGECKHIFPNLPCGKTYVEKIREWDATWKKFREEEKMGMHKIPPKKEYDSKGRIVSILYETASPNIPCGFIEGKEQCAPGWCKDSGRGEFVRRKNAKGGNKLEDFLDEKHKKKLGKVAENVGQLYKAFDKLEEKEDGYK